VAVILGWEFPSGAVITYLPGAQAAQRRAARGHCPRGRHSDGALNEPGGAFPPRRNPAVSGAIGYIATFGLIASIQADRDIWTVAAFGIIPLAVGIVIFSIGRSSAATARASS